MWIVGGKRNFSQMNDIERQFYDMYLRIDPYIMAFLEN